MKAVIQRVTRVSVEVNGQLVGRIGAGLLGVAKGDEEPDGRYLVEKIRTVRIFCTGKDESLVDGHWRIGLAGLPVYAPRTDDEWPSPQL